MGWPLHYETARMLADAVKHRWLPVQCHRHLSVLPNAKGRVAGR